MTFWPALRVPSFLEEVLALAYTGRVALETSASTVSMVTLLPPLMAVEPEPSRLPVLPVTSPSGTKGSEPSSVLPAVEVWR